MIRGATLLLLGSVGLAVAGHHWPGHHEPQLPPKTITGHAMVIDGDTIMVNGIRVRLYGIDSPEMDQMCKDAAGADYRCGMLATSVLEEQIGGRQVTCTPVDIDKYGRFVSICVSNGWDLSAYMVLTGWAVAYRRYTERYIEAEDSARVGKRGLWQGEFMEPEAWRHGHQ